MSVLVGVSNKGDDCKRLAGGPAPAVWDILGLLIRARVNIADAFESCFVDSESEVQLIVEH